MFARFTDLLLPSLLNIISDSVVKAFGLEDRNRIRLSLT